jgi:hypothetical protein
MWVDMSRQMDDVSSFNTLLAVKKLPSSFSFARKHSRICSENFYVGLLHDAITGVCIKSDVR